MIEFRRVVKRYGPLAAVDGVDLACEAGAVEALIGPSGCGKTTLLRMAAGLTTADEGEVRFGGVPLTAARLPEIRRRLGYMIQEGGLFPHLTARDNAALMARYLRWSPQRIAERIEELIALTHLSGDLLARYPRQLSGGQRQRVSLMRALMLDPDVLLLDEPLGDLDPMVRADLQQELRSIFTRLRTTVLLVTHDLAEAAILADRMTLLRRGQIVQQGTLEDMVARPADEFVAKFVRAQRPLAGALP
ncbi:MAG TPA: ATP-binding cassette domain-containing protein [Lacipirellulaceae bacterium]|nr:ATP-binding cassette domain-containing protein [Lacipirellulaceae bacterium]